MKTTELIILSGLNYDLNFLEVNQIMIKSKLQLTVRITIHAE